MIALPKRSGSASASTPGRPWKASSLRSSANVTGATVRATGSLMGDRSRPSLRNFSSNSNVTTPRSSSKTAPTNFPHRWIRASATSVSAIAAPSCTLTKLAGELAQRDRRDRGLGQERVEELESIEGPQQLDEGRQPHVLSSLGLLHGRCSQTFVAGEILDAHVVAEPVIAEPRPDQTLDLVIRLSGYQCSSKCLCRHVTDTIRYSIVS